MTDAELIANFLLEAGGQIRWVAPLEAWPDKGKINWCLRHGRQGVQAIFRFDGKQDFGNCGLIELSHEPPDSEEFLRCGRLYCDFQSFKEPAVQAAWTPLPDFVKKNFEKIRIRNFTVSGKTVHDTVFVGPQAQKWLAEKPARYVR